MTENLNVEFINENNSTSEETSGDILENLLQEIHKVDFKKLVFFEDSGLAKGVFGVNHDTENDDKSKKEFEPNNNERITKEIQHLINETNVSQKQYIIISIEHILSLTDRKGLGLCKYQNSIYGFNGTFWIEIDNNAFAHFLGKAAEKMGIPKLIHNYYQFTDSLVKQFHSRAFLPTTQISKEKIKINLLNGTFEIGFDGAGRLMPFDKNDFITYQLPFFYEPTATAPTFEKFLNRVLPKVELQHILAEFLGYVFINNGMIKIEKVLMLLGSGANGKSVFFSIVNALLGDINFSSYSMQNLTDYSGYYRAKIGNKRVNYASEINGIRDTSVFKKMASGEPIEARLPYGEPFMLYQYAKLIFNANELPKEVELTDAFFRRFLIIPFDVVIPENEQDKELANKIIKSELAGIFNWVLKGLNRLLAQKDFTISPIVEKARADYELQNDTVLLFVDEKKYIKNTSKYILASDLFNKYREFCSEDGLKPLSKKFFTKRLDTLGFTRERKNIGNVYFMYSEIKNILEK